MATLDPEFDRRLRALLTAGGEAGYNPQVASGYRSPEDQARAIDSVSRNVNGRPASFVEYSRGIPGYAAPVGGSMHQKGLAADLSGNGVDYARKIAADYGLRFPESLRGTDPNHAEIDPKFWGPVQDPRDRAATAAANEAPPLRVAEIPANKGGIGPNGTPNPPSVTPQVAGYQARDPRMTPQLDQGGGGLLSGIAKFATNTFTNPLFQAGAAMVNAGSRGLNVGGGFLEGAQAAATASERQQAEAKRLRELAAEQNKAMLWQDMVTNPNPVWAKDIDPGTMQLARVMGPVDGMNLIMGLVQKNQIGQLDRMKLEETKRDHDIKARQAEAQYLEAQNVNADRAQTQDVIRRQKQLEMEAAQREAEFEARTFGTKPPPPLAPPAQPRQIQPLPQLPPRRMSNEVPQQDPMLIPTQAAEQPDTATATAQPSPKMIEIPRNGGEMVTPEDARKFGQSLLANPKYRAMGQDIIAQADAAMAPKDQIEKGARGELQKSAIGDVNHLARLNDIAASYNENYLKLAPRLRNSMMGTAEFAGMKVSEPDKQNLAEFATFRAKTIANFNLLLKEASGAAVTEQELKRMMMQEPNAEANGWFSRPDSPTEFMAKLNNSRTMLLSAIARKNYMLSEEGLKLDPESVAKLAGIGRMPLGLDQMKDVMSKKQAEVERKIRLENPRIKPEELQPIVRNQMRGIFGI